MDGDAEHKPMGEEPIKDEGLVVLFSEADRDYLQNKMREFVGMNVDIHRYGIRGQQTSSRYFCYP